MSIERSRYKLFRASGTKTRENAPGCLITAMVALLVLTTNVQAKEEVLASIEPNKDF